MDVKSLTEKIKENLSDDELTFLIQCCQREQVTLLENLFPHPTTPEKAMVKSIAVFAQEILTDRSQMDYTDALSSEPDFQEIVDKLSDFEPLQIKSILLDVFDMVHPEFNKPLIWDLLFGLRSMLSIEDFQAVVDDPRLAVNYNS